MKTAPLFAVLLLLLGLGLSSCYPNQSLSTDELDLIATNYDSEYFSSKAPGTYHMPDTIVNIGDPDGEEEAQLTREEMDFILAQIEQNLGALGYDRVPTLEEGNLPDVVVTASAIIIKNTSVGGGCYPWYPGWGWYPWYPGWGWGAGWCYPLYAYSYTTGTLVIDMVDPEESTEESIKRVWSAGINGLLRSSQAGNRDFVESAIDQAFTQSEFYLKQ